MALPKPIGCQIDVLSLYPAGNTIVLGTAGSGKTVLAVMRSAYLSDSRTSTAGPTLLLTFNRYLSNYLKSLKNSVDLDLEMKTFHKFAIGYLDYRGMMGRDVICKEPVRSRLIEQSFNAVAVTAPGSPFAAKPINFVIAEITWLSEQGIRSLDQYLIAKRRGREQALDKRQRELIWQVRNGYYQLRGARNYKYDYDDIAMYISDALAVDNTDRRYRHIVIDEGQAFTASMFEAVKNSLPNDGSLTVFADVAQQTHGKKLSWRDSFPETIPWKFEHNYRNSKEIADLALEISKMPYFQGDADLVSPKGVKARGVLPSLVRCQNDEYEIELVLDQARTYSKNQSVAILCQHYGAVDFYYSRLGNKAVKIDRQLTSWDVDQQVFIGIYEMARGLEFDTVIIPGLSKTNMPSSDHIDAMGLNEAEYQDGRLLYIAITRAKTNLIMTYVGRTVTSLLKDISPNFINKSQWPLTQ